MLVLVGFGYWYTVLPVYQKSLLDEEIAKKTIELHSATTELTILRKGIHEKESELASLQHSIDVYKNDSRQARSDATKAKRDSAVAQQDAAEKYSTLRSQSLGLFWGELIQQCVGESISNDEKLMQCIETRAKTSRSYSQLEPGDGVAVLQKIRASVAKNRDAWNQIFLTYNENYRVLASQKAELVQAGELLKTKPKATTPDGINESISAKYNNEISLIHMQSAMSHLLLQTWRDKEKVLRQILNISV